MNWIQALKQWNTSKGGAWCVPKKGTTDYDEVRAIMSGTTPAGKKTKGKKAEVDVANVVEGKRARKPKMME